jgi:cytochrome d ubiquinol oxidase subunit II
LFTDFHTGTRPGALDWFTLSVGGFALITLAGHGALFLWWKCEGALADRCLEAARSLWVAIVALALAVAGASWLVRPSLPGQLFGRIIAWPFILCVPGGLTLVVLGMRRRRERMAFLGSVLFIAGLLGATAAAVYPVILPSTLDPAWSLTVANSASSGRGLAIGFYWWTPAVALAIGYFVYLFRSFRGKVRGPGHY